MLVLPVFWVLQAVAIQNRAEVGFDPIVSAKAVIARQAQSTPAQRSIEIIVIVLLLFAVVVCFVWPTAPNPDASLLSITA